MPKICSNPKTSKMKCIFCDALMTKYNDHDKVINNLTAPNLNSLVRSSDRFIPAYSLRLNKTMFVLLMPKT